MSHAKIIIIAGSCLLISGCSLFLGNVKPVDEKSEAYGVADLAKENPEWTRLKPDPNASETQVSDVAYQSSRTASIISLNSACRPSVEASKETSVPPHDELKSYTNLLLMGFTDITQRDEKDVMLQARPALKTTIQGKLNGEQTKLDTVVLKRGICIYDLMFVARPEHFAGDEPEFSHFVASLRLKE